MFRRSEIRKRSASNGVGIRQAGFSLIEIAVVLVIITVMMAAIMPIIRASSAAKVREETNQNMQKVESALVGFVATTRRLPCPADGSLAPTDVNAGLERRSASGTCDAMSTGVVPWRSVGLTPLEVQDGWQSMLTYRVPLHLTIDNGMTMADCDPAGSNPVVFPASPNHLCVAGCLGTNLATCTSPSLFLANKGLQIKNVAGTVLANPAAVPPTGAAFVVISAGENRGVAFNANGVAVAATDTVGTEEAHNQNNQVLQAYYVDDDLNASTTNAHFDDIVRRPTVSTIIGKANLSARAH